MPTTPPPERPPGGSKPGRGVAILAAVGGVFAALGLAVAALVGGALKALGVELRPPVPRPPRPAREVPAAGPPEPPRPIGPTFESRDLNARLLGWIALGFAATGLVLHLALGGMLKLFTALGGPPQVTPANPSAEPQWVGEVQANRTYQAGVQHQLATYGWVDRQGGVVHLPIDRAMDLVASRGITWRLGNAWPGTQQRPPAAHRANPTPTPPGLIPSPPPVGGLAP